MDHGDDLRDGQPPTDALQGSVGCVEFWSRVLAEGVVRPRPFFEGDAIHDGLPDLAVVGEVPFTLRGPRSGSRRRVLGGFTGEAFFESVDNEERSAAGKLVWVVASEG